MLKAVRISAFQQMPNYRKPASFLIKESYPLPPYSTVIGLVHAMCGWKSYVPMRVSVQGDYAGTVSDYATNYVFGGVKFEKGRHTFGVDAGSGKLEGVTRTPKNYELLTDVELVLHIIPDDQTLVDEIARALDMPPVYPSLGRYEDSLQITSVSVVELERADGVVAAKTSAYVPCDSIDADSEGLTGTVYKLGKVFGHSGKKNMRQWTEIVRARHVCAGCAIAAAGGRIFMDKANGEAVFPA